MKENAFFTLKFVYLLTSTSQDSDAVIGIIDSVFEQISVQFRNKSIYLRVDNAGCNHNQSLVCVLPYLENKHDHKIKRFDFCEPQTRTDVCDRIIAQIKRHLRVYVDQGNYIINANKAIDGLQYLI